MDRSEKNTLARFCFDKALQLEEDHELSSEDMACLHKESIEMAIYANDISTMVDSCKQFVFHSNRINKPADSLKYLKKVLPFAEGIPKYELIVHKFLAGTYNNDLKKLDKAVLHAKKWIEIARNIGDKESELHGHEALGQTYVSLACYDDALDSFKKVLEIAQETHRVEDEMEAHYYIASVYECMEKNDDAILHTLRYLHFVIETNDPQAMNTAWSLGRAHPELGRGHLDLKHHQDGIDSGRKFIEKAREIGDRYDEVSAYLLMGRIYTAQQDYDNGIKYCKKAIELATTIGDERSEAEAYRILGKVYETLEQYNDAVRYNKKCIDIAQETGDKKGEMHGYLLLAQVYLLTMQLNDASLSIDEGMAIAKELGDEKAEVRFELIRFFLHAAVGLVRTDKVNVAPTACFEDDLLKDLDQAVKTGNKENERFALFKISCFYLSKQNHQKAINSLQRLKENTSHPSLNLYCCMYIGKSYEMMGENDMALRCYKEGLPIAESCSDNYLRFQFYYAFGKVLVLLNKEPNLAEHYLREAIRCFEEVFTTLGSRDDFKIAIFDLYKQGYKLLAILLIKGKQNEEALLVLDRCRARVLKEYMISNFKMEQDESNVEHLKYSDVLPLVSGNDFSISYYSLPSDVVLEFLVEGETPLKFLTCTSHSLQIHVDTLFYEMGVREEVNCEDRSLDKEQDIQKEQKRSQKEHVRLLSQQTASLLNLDSKHREKSTSEVLFDILECDRILSSKEDEVVVIPEGPLYKVPFTALRDPRTGKYFSETKRIRLAPSLATLKHFQDFPVDQTKNAQPLIIGDPLVGKVMMDGEVREDIKPLPGARGEAAEISVLLETPALLTIHATKPAVLERLQQGASLVHIAAHGSLAKGTIVLAPSPEIRAAKIPDEKDYMLTMADVQQAQVRAQLVVLSCCHSGRGEIRAEGVVGMCRAFLASGARAVVASLWAIDDNATLEFMIAFYLCLKQGKSASVSLQEAMKEMRNTTSYSEPKYRAPFFLMGDDVTLKL